MPWRRAEKAVFVASDGCVGDFEVASNISVMAIGVVPDDETVIVYLLDNQVTKIVGNDSHC